MIFYIHTDTKWTLSRVLTKTNQTIVTKLVWLLKSERASDQLDFEDGRTSMTRGLNSAASIWWRSYGCCCVQIIDCPRPRGGEGCVWLSGKHQPEEVQSPPSVLARFVKSLESALPV